MNPLLNEFERRVLGALIEKSMASPDYYPMTENALVAACNQKQNRDPIMSLDSDAVWDALESLREQGLITVVLPAPGARTKRYRHEVDTQLGWQKRERAVMAELLLRGPQTPGELRGRCSRLVPFDDLDAVTLVLDCLAQRDPPMVKPLAREPGRSAIRYTHLLYPEDETPPTTSETLPSAPVARGESGSSAIEPLEQQIESLRTGLQNVQDRLDALERRFEGT